MSETNPTRLKIFHFIYGSLHPKRIFSSLRTGRDSVAAKQAAQVIERAWCRHRDRQMFRLLKHAVCAAEHALSNDILRRLSPREAELLKDPSLNVKVKFR